MVHIDCGTVRRYFIDCDRGIDCDRPHVDNCAATKGGGDPPRDEDATPGFAAAPRRERRHQGDDCPAEVEER